MSLLKYFMINLFYPCLFDKVCVTGIVIYFPSVPSVSNSKSKHYLKKKIKYLFSSFGIVWSIFKHS